MSPPPSPSGNADRRAVAGLMVLLVGLGALRLLAAGSVHLTEDEAYYRLWAQHPGLGYYDHPPMIAWWIWAGQAIAGDTPLGVRLLPVMSSLLTSLLVFDLGQRMAGRPAGLAAALFYNATLTVGAGAMLAIPDTPASLFWVLTLWALQHAVERPAFWLCAGAAAGLGCLSKYSALFLAPGALLWLALTADGRRRLASPWPWCGALIAAAIFSANILWNADHHWITFAKQFGRAAASRFAPRYLGEFITGQFALLNPAVAVLAGLGAVTAFGRRRAEAGVALLAGTSSIPFLAYLVLHSLHDRVQAHWPAPLYPAAALLAAFAAQEATGWTARLARFAPVGLALTALALAYMALPRGFLAKGDPADQLRGWPTFAAQVDGVRAAHGAAWVGTLSYGVAGQLAAERQIAAAIVQLDERDRYADFGPAPDISRPGLVVDLRRRLDPARLKACFAQVGPVTEIDRGPGRSADSRYAAVPVAGARQGLLSQGCDI